MGRFAARRVALSIPVLFILSFLVYVVLINLADPDRAIRAAGLLNRQEVSRLRRILGLDKEIVAGYLSWVSHFFRGQWGISLFSNRPVARDIREALTNSAVLGFAAVILSFLIGSVLGVWAAARQQSALDRFVSVTSFLGLSIPGFWLALLLQLFLGVLIPRWLGLGHPVLPIAGRIAPGTEGFHIGDRVVHMVLPVAVLTAHFTAIFVRYVRSSLIEVLHADYMRTAQAKGAREARLLVRHALPNALIPVITQLALDVGAIAGGFMVVEFVFEWPGMGRFFIVALSNRDWPQVLPWLMVTAAFIMALNLVADLFYAILDPRIRY